MTWRKKNKEPEAARQTKAPAATEQTERSETPLREKRSVTDHVLFGKSVEIKGELTGREDVLIDGRIDGKVAVIGHSLTVGPNAQIHAEVSAKSVVVIGIVIGNIQAEDRVEVAATGTVEGDISAGRVVLAEGARFKGKVDMGASTKRSTSTPQSAAAPRTTSQPPRPPARDRPAPV